MLKMEKEAVKIFTRLVARRDCSVCLRSFYGCAVCKTEHSEEFMVMGFNRWLKHDEEGQKIARFIELEKGEQQK